MPNSFFFVEGFVAAIEALHRVVHSKYKVDRDPS